VEKCGLDSSGSRNGSSAGSCEYGNEPSVSVNDGEFLTGFSRRTLLRGGGISQFTNYLYVT